MYIHFQKRILIDLGQNIRYARLRRRFSAELLAERAGISRNTLRAIERGDPNISESDNSQDLELARNVAQFFRLKSNTADKIINEVVKIVKNWRIEASNLNISKREQDQMARAFRIADAA